MRSYPLSSSVTLLLCLFRNGYCFCNLGNLTGVHANSSSVYTFTNLDPKISLYANRSLDGKFRNFIKGDCAGTDVEKQHNNAWWMVILPSTSRIYKLNLIFRENCFCNLGNLTGVHANSSSVYTFTNLDPKISLYANRSLDGKFRNFIKGDCAGTDVEKQHNNAWWMVILPSTSRIYKLNLIFRENFTRHAGFYLFINKQEKMVADLASLPAVYHEQDPKASSQNVIMFPRGYEGKQIYLYLNKTGENNTLDLCEVEILGCTGSDENCKCPVTLPEELPVDFLETEVAFRVNNNITLQCHSRYILLQNSSGLLNECNFQMKCKNEADSIQVNSASYRCLEVCRNDAYNESTTVLVNLNSSKAYYLKEENITLQCKYRHKLIIGQLTRTCLGNLTWTGDKPVCQRCQCPCERLKTQNFITDPQVLAERIEEIKAKLKVKIAKLSSKIRQKTSASDERKSVQGIGMALGVGIITFIFSIIICSDLPLLYRHIRHGAF